jgi:hypothetical protein
MKNFKKSQSQVEMVLSFSIFIGFVFILFLFLNPVNRSDVSYAVLDNVQNIVFNNISVSYSYVGLILDTPISSGTCFYLDNPFNLSEKTIVLDENNKITNSKNANGFKLVSTGSSRLYKIYFSDLFNSYDEVNSCNPLSIGYSFGALSIQDSILLEHLKILNDSYFEDYSLLKQSLGIKDEFEFMVYDLNKSKVIFDTTLVHKSKTSHVLSREIPMKVIDKDINETDVIFNIRVW